MRSTRLGRLSFGILAALLLAACDSTPKGTPLANSGLKLSLKAGDTHRIRMIREERLIQGNMGAKETLSRHLGIDCTFRVVNVEPDGTAAIKVTFNGGRYKQGGEMAKSEDLPPIFKNYSGVDNPLAHIQGQSLQVMVTADWQILSIGGMYDYETKTGILATIAKEYELDSNETKTDALGDYAAGWRESIGFDVGRQICSDLMDLFPAGMYDHAGQGYDDDGLGAGVGDGPECTWYVDTAGGAAVVDVKTRAKLESKPDSGDNEYGPAFTYELKGTKKGALRVDKNKGWIVGGRIDEDYSGNKVAHLGKQTLKYPASFRRVIRFELAK